MWVIHYYVRCCIWRLPRRSIRLADYSADKHQLLWLNEVFWHAGHGAAHWLVELDELQNLWRCGGWRKNWHVITGLLGKKLVLGLAAYGWTKTLIDPSCITTGCTMSGPGLTGCHGKSGVLPWFEIKENYLDDPGMYDSLSYNLVMESELITNGNTTFASFNNKSTFNKKYQYTSSECLRGIMWYGNVTHE